MKGRVVSVWLLVGGLLMAGCEPCRLGHRVAALEDSAWKESVWISAKDAPVFDEEVKEGSRAADGTSWFVRITANAREVRRATWMTTALGVYELYVNGKVIGNDFLKPGFTHPYKTRRSFTYDVTDAMRRGAGEANILAAEVSAGWWRDKIVSPRERKGFVGRKSAFRGVLEVEYADGTTADFDVRYGWNVGEIAQGLRKNDVFEHYITDARYAWSDISGATVYQHEWVNPHPEKDVVSLTLTRKSKYLEYVLCALSMRVVDGGPVENAR